MEAHRHSRSEELAPTHFMRYSLPQRSRQSPRYSGRNDSIWACPQAELVTKSVARMKARFAEPYWQESCSRFREGGEQTWALQRLCRMQITGTGNRAQLSEVR